ncbi:class D sortase [Kyrpidia spormannii]|uniref:Sortase family protein n=1 Tax=Kyrpidia spormannii TaxID=2055160 RepID=A0A6F9ECK1_9BACL|nr:class D sortase [Kyrpidia spormannii]CAB3394284.1 Sortase family protein [Kyrpidia spormannii]
MAITKSVVSRHPLRHAFGLLIRIGLGVWLATGTAMIAYFGWRYTHQLLGIGRSSLPAYSPPQREKAKLWPVTPQPGTKIGDLEIPSLHICVPVVQGTDPDQLEQGAGHWMTSALPGQLGNVYIAGHRDTVFASLRGIKIGDTIVFHTLYGDFVYKVTSTTIVPETDVSVLHSSHSGQTMTLQTCYPFFYFGFAPDRYLVHAELIESPRPHSAALHPQTTSGG